jgi:hypothetical protein
VHSYCVESEKLIVNHCTDGLSVFLVPVGQDSHAWLVYVAPRGLFEELRRLVVRTQSPTQPEPRAARAWATLSLRTRSAMTSQLALSTVLLIGSRWVQTPGHGDPIAAACGRGAPGCLRACACSR